MYIPGPNRETDPTELRRFMRENPLCALVTMGTHGLVASHIPVVLHESESGFWRSALSCGPGQLATV